MKPDRIMLLYGLFVLVGTIGLTLMGGEPSNFSEPVIAWNPAGITMRITIVALPVILVAALLAYLAANKPGSLMPWVASIVGLVGTFVIFPMRSDVADMAAAVGQWMASALANAALASVIGMMFVGVAQIVAPMIATREGSSTVTPAGSRHCLDCGEPLVEGKAFCGNCGSRIED